jgi:hypothetical protein
VHAWVAILPGPRDVAEPFFIGKPCAINLLLEPSSGKVYATEDNDYLGVEAVFSPEGYFVNMQVCYDGLKVHYHGHYLWQGISFDLRDASKWESVFGDSPISKGRLTEEEEEERDNRKRTHVIPEIPPSWVNPITISPEQYEMKCPAGYKSVTYRNAKYVILLDSLIQKGNFRRLSSSRWHDC